VGPRVPGRSRACPPAASSPPGSIRRRQPVGQARRPSSPRSRSRPSRRTSPTRPPTSAWRSAHQPVRQRRADHGAAAEAHDRQARGHAAPVGKPLDERRDRRDVAEPEAAPANDARPEPQQPHLVQPDAERRDEEAAAPAEQAATTPALRGPSRSSHGPNTAADEPSITKNSVYIQPRVLIFQSSGAGSVMPIARLSGSQNTLKP
jgi:hypothetical protein